MLSIIPALQFYNILHSLLFAGTVVTFEAMQLTTRPTTQLTIGQIAAEVAFILMPAVVKAWNPRFLAEHQKGEREEIGSALNTTDFALALVIAAQVLEHAGIGKHLVVSLEATLLVVFAILMIIVFANRPSPRIEVPDTSLPLPRICATKALVPIALGSYYLFANAGNIAYAIASAASLLVLYFVASILVWNRNLAIV